MPADLSRFFQARSILLVGASADPRKTAGKPLRLLTKYGYQGDIILVNPAHAEIGGHRSYAKVADIPEAPELALVLTPADSVLPTVAAVLDRGGRDIIVVSGGFSDVGNQALQTELVDLVRSSGGCLLGPNCLGLANIQAGLTATFAGSLYHDEVEPGQVSLVTQSGSVGNAIIMRLRERRLGLAKWMAVGNEADITALDAVDYLIADPETQVIGCFVESVRNGAEWSGLAARAAEAGKPLVIQKVGRSLAGTAAVESHSGKSAGSYEAWRQIARRSGITVAESLDELADKLYRLDSGPQRPECRLAALGTGGFGVIVSDAAEEWGVPLASLADATVSGLRSLLPTTATVHNPVDPTPVTDQTFYQTVELLIADPGVDVVLCTVTSLSRAYDQMPDHLRQVGGRARQLGKTLVISYFSPADRLPAAAEAELHRSYGVLFYPDPVLAIRALGQHQDHLRLTGKSATAAGARSSHTRMLPWPDAGALLVRYGLHPVPTTVLRSRADAAAYAEQTGKIVLKLDDPAMPHKTENNAVHVDVRGAQAAAAAFDDLAAKCSPRGQVIGQEFIDGGTEVITGCWVDPEMGRVISLNAGGILTELAGQPSIGTCPLSPQQATSLLQENVVGTLLKGYRGTAALSLDAVASVAAALSECFAAESSLLELEINPLIVRPDGPHIVDVLAVTRDAEERHA